jgi:hypothetical protein
MRQAGLSKKTWMELDYPRVAIDDSSTRLEGQNLTIAATLAGQPQVMRQRCNIYAKDNSPGYSENMKGH